MLLRELWLDPHLILVTEKIQEDNIKEWFLRGFGLDPNREDVWFSLPDCIPPFFSFVDIVSRDLR